MAKTFPRRSRSSLSRSRGGRIPGGTTITRLGASDGSGVASGGGGGGGAHESAVTGKFIHSSGNTIVCDFTNAAYSDYTAITVLANLSGSVLTRIAGTAGVSDVSLQGVVETSANVFTAKLTGTPITGEFAVHLTFTDLASIVPV